MDRPWVIVSCGATKLDRPAFAGEMYTGPFHRGCRRYALSLTDPERILILSARYGLLRLDQRIEPYNQRMGRPGSVSAETVRRQAREIGIDSDPILIMGQDYERVACAVWPKSPTPLRGVGVIGKKLRWMKEHRGRIT